MRLICFCVARMHHRQSECSGIRSNTHFATQHSSTPSIEAGELDWGQAPSDFGLRSSKADVAGHIFNQLCCACLADPGPRDDNIWVPCTLLPYCVSPHVLCRNTIRSSLHLQRPERPLSQCIVFNTSMCRPRLSAASLRGLNGTYSRHHAPPGFLHFEPQES